MLNNIREVILALSNRKNDTKGGLILDSPATNVFLVSYPKSGNTWLRFLIGNYLSGNRCNFANSHLIIPDVHFNPDYAHKMKGQKFIKSHMPYTDKYSKVIYLARDGRDVAVSYFYHSIKYRIISPDMNFSSFLDLFNSGHMDKFSLWNDHAVGWLNHLSDEIILISYEEMKSDTFKCLKKVLEFSGIAFDEVRARHTIEVSSFQNMQKREVLDNPVSGLRKSNTKMKFVRNGQSQQWKEAFSDMCLERFVELHGEALTRLGYI